MPNVALYNMNGEKVDEISLREEIFGVEINEHAMREVVLAYLANRRRGTASTKTRAEVRGGGAKPWRQKGTGRARHGSTRSPIWTGGGVTFGPKPRQYKYSVPKKVKRLALKSALAAKVQEGGLIAVNELSFEEPKTKQMTNVLSGLNVDTKALIITGENDANTIKSARNIEGVKAAKVNNINVYDILNHNKLIMTKEAIAKVEEVLS